jgi:pyruvate dehydrogenase E1 component alpha subunit
METRERPAPPLLLRIFRDMARLKANDDRLTSLVKSGRVATTFYSWRGQEAIPSAAFAALNPDDYLCTIYRGLHDAIAKGVPLDRLWAELLGRATGTCKGKGGPMHITHPASGLMVTTGVVGSSMPIATGLGYASQVLGDGRVTVAMFGDGASNIGAFHESLNLASVWKLPVIFICQNNGYAEHTRFSKCTSVESVADRASAYSMVGASVDGNDPVAVYQAVDAAARRARGGEGPTLIEAVTFRFRGHVFGDDDAYMLPGEKDSWAGKDPYPCYRNHLLQWGVATEVELAAIELEAQGELDKAIEFAMASAPSEIAELEKDVFGGVAA